MSLADILAQLPVYGRTADAPIRKDPQIAKLDKLRIAAQHYDCVLCGKDKKYTVGAHCDDVSVKGIGKKAPGWLIAYVCGDPGGCHDRMDGRVGKLPKAAKRALWADAYWRTAHLWWRDGLVRMADGEGY